MRARAHLRPACGKRLFQRPKMRAAGSRRKSGNARGTKQRCVSAPTGWIWRAGRRIDTEGRMVLREFCGEKKEAGSRRDAGLLLPGTLKTGFMVTSGTGRANCGGCQGFSQREDCR